MLYSCLGNHLVEKGDVDGSMYFINKGEVDVYDIHENKTFLVMTIRNGDSFGELQGLCCAPHDFSYKARTVVDALILKHNDWQYLVQWFPASNEVIQKRAHEHHFVGNPDAMSFMSNKSADEEILFEESTSSRGSAISRGSLISKGSEKYKA